MEMLMNRAILNLDQTALDTIHTRSLELLQDAGICFPSEKALRLFKRHGMRFEGNTVFFKERDIAQALSTVPQAYDIQARNPEKRIHVGGHHYVMAPGYGPPFIIESTGRIRDTTLDDAHKFCMLVQTSKYLDFNSALVVQPTDVPDETAHLDLLLAALLLTDKPLMASSVSEAAALDSLELARIVWGDLKRPVMIALINSLSPLQYATEMVEALMIFAAAGQPVIIHSACMLGASGPITMAGSLIVSNAATLAGICLSQLIRPGTPVVYGLGGSPMDMRTGGSVNGSPEDVHTVAIASAMGRYYHMPCRGQGALTESFCLDYQAGMESAMMLTAAALSGINVGLHACGTLGSMLAMSFEKFIADEELCGSVKRLMRPIELTEDALAIDLIKQVGQKGHYMAEAHTLKRCRDEFFIPDLGNRLSHGEWFETESRDINTRARKLLRERLASYKKPDGDPLIEKQLNAYAARKRVS